LKILNKKSEKIATIAIALATIFSALWYVSITEASIGYNLGKSDYYFELGSNWVYIYSSNGQGKNDGGFNLVVTFRNATFSALTEQPYQKVDNSTIKFSFVLRAGESASKQVFFTINPHASGFSIDLTIEKQSFFIHFIPFYPITLKYVWNITQNSYILIK
jgi:hypothetical protein